MLNAVIDKRFKTYCLTKVIGWDRVGGMRKIILISLIILIVLSLSLVLTRNFHKNVGILGSRKERIESETNLWQPQLFNENIGQDKLSINAKAALALDFETGQVFYSKKPHLHLPFASLAKIMTAMVALDHAAPDEILEVPPEAAMEKLPDGSSFMGVTPGEKYTVQDLLYGLLLPSGNDAARTLALSLAGDLDTFVYWMNRKAKAIGLSDTHFTNPSGLDDSNSYSTVFDLAKLSHFALTRYPQIAQIVATRGHEILYTTEHKYLFFGNFNDLMLIYPNIDGVKPGNTEEAGSCLIATSTREGKRVMVIVLGTPARNPETIKLLDFSFERLGVEPAVQTP